ncbi:hypothetical protein BsWGS_21341 [Bradybaena similaris]
MKLLQRTPVLDLSLSVINILLIFSCVNCKWCTRTTSEKHIFTTTEPSQCLQSYEHRCNWFTEKKCTYYELVECFKEKNHTVVMYKIVEECCPGYQLDPARNDTCIVKLVRRQNYTRQYYKSEDDDLLFGLSQGAYAGIICAFLFVCCVIVLIIVRMLKRSLRNSAVKQNAGMEQEMVEKMIPAPT